MPRKTVFGQILKKVPSTKGLKDMMIQTKQAGYCSPYSMLAPVSITLWPPK